MKLKIKKIHSLVKSKLYKDAVYEIDQIVENRPKFLSSFRNFCLNKIGDEKNDCQHVRNCIVVNTVIKEVNELLTLFVAWKLWFLASESELENIDLKVIFDSKNEEIFDFIKNVINIFSFELYFRNIEVISIDIPVEYNFYIRHGQSKLKNELNLIYGEKGGPNFQFFAILKSLRNSNYDCVYLCETDCYPIQKDWQRLIFNEAKSTGNFYVLGSPFMGQSKIDPSIGLHINGSAIYKISEIGFNSFLGEWESLLIDTAKDVPYVAYDWVWEHYFNRVINVKNWEHLSFVDMYRYYDFRKKNKLGDFIINLAGESENTDVGRYHFDDLNVVFPDAYLVHAKYFSGESMLLAGSVLRDVDLMNRVKDDLKSILGKYSSLLDNSRIEQLMPKYFLGSV
jgi:hypothetical protein